MLWNYFRAFVFRKKLPKPRCEKGRTMSRFLNQGMGGYRRFPKRGEESHVIFEKQNSYEIKFSISIPIYGSRCAEDFLYFNPWDKNWQVQTVKVPANIAMLAVMIIQLQFDTATYFIT